MISEKTATSRQAARLNTTIAAYLTASSLVRPDGTVQQAAQRAVPGLARDRIAGHHADAQRQERQAHRQREHDQREEHPVPGQLIQEREAAAATGGDRQPEHDAEEHRHDRQDAEQGQVARTAEHQPELGIKEPQPGGNGVNPGWTAARPASPAGAEERSACPAAAGGAAANPGQLPSCSVDIEALAG